MQALRPTLLDNLLNPVYERRVKTAEVRDEKADGQRLLKWNTTDDALWR